MKNISLSIIFFLVSASLLLAQKDDFDVSLQYVDWIRQAIKENRMNDADAAIVRAQDFSDVNSDISYLAAILSFNKRIIKNNVRRSDVIKFLDTAIEVNRWYYYNENEAIVLKAEQLVNMRKFSSALAVLDQIKEGAPIHQNDTDSTLLQDAAIIRLKAFRGIAENNQGLTEHPETAFRSIVLSVMNRYSRDPRPAKIFLEYLQGRTVNAPAASDQQILDLIIKRLPVLAEFDSELAWMVSPYMKNIEDTKRLLASYRSGGLLKASARDFRPHPASIPQALHYGLIDDKTAAEELFSGTRGSNNPLPAGINFNNLPVLDFYVLNNVYGKLGSEEGRQLFTRALYDFEGFIVTDSDNDEIIEQIVYIKKGVAQQLLYDKTQDNNFDIKINFDLNGLPVSADLFILGESSSLGNILWERYPHTEKVGIASELFLFRPADFSYKPVSFIAIGGSRTHTGISFPVLDTDNFLTRRMLVYSCASIERPSSEFDQATERITLENGIPLNALEFSGNKIISITEFDSGIPVIQYIDTDLDGRMETIRRFHRPGQNFPWPDTEEKFDYHRLIASSESDWTGDGRYKTIEEYLKDGSIINKMDIDGDGIPDEKF